MSKPIPLTAPDGRIYTYACGVCHRLASHGSRLIREGDKAPTGPDKRSLEFDRDMADDCCTCRECGKVRAGISIRCRKCQAEQDKAWKIGEPVREAEAARRHEAFEAALSKAKDRDAALRLRGLLSDLSEEYVCSSWDEHVIGQALRAVRGEDVQVSHVNLAEWVPELRRLQEKAGGWWTYEAFQPEPAP